MRNDSFYSDCFCSRGPLDSTVISDPLNLTNREVTKFYSEFFNIFNFIKLFFINIICNFGLNVLDLFFAWCVRFRFQRIEFKCWYRNQVFIFLIWFPLTVIVRGLRTI